MVDLFGSELEEIAATLKALNAIGAGRGRMVALEGSLRVIDSEGEDVGSITNNASLEDDWVFHYDEKEDK